MGLTLDPQLIRDLTVLITSSTVGGMLLEALRQPVINGFFIAGSAVGPGGLKLIKVCMPAACMPASLACLGTEVCMSLWACSQWLHINWKASEQRMRLPWHCSLRAFRLQRI